MEAMRALDRTTTGAQTDWRVRLALAESGTFSCTAVPLPPNPERLTYTLSLQKIVADALCRHKTNWRDLYENEFARLTKLLACDEAIFLNQRGEVAEGSRTNVFVARDGMLLTPPLSAGALDGCLRRALIDEGRCVEAVLLPGDLTNGEVYLGNSLRGLIRAVSAT
jgi:para-aminobenzoate synthetase/4-amino-4-deoxychorismate lyase